MVKLGVTLAEKVLDFMVFANNFFTSIVLIAKLLTKGIHPKILNVFTLDNMLDCHSMRRLL